MSGEHTATSDFHDGDIVRMNGHFLCPPEDLEREWIVHGEPYSCFGMVYVKLEGFPAGFCTDGLELIRKAQRE